MIELRIRLLSILVATTKIYLIMKSCYITSSRLLWLLLFPVSLALYKLVNPSQSRIGCVRSIIIDIQYFANLSQATAELSWP